MMTLVIAAAAAAAQPTAPAPTNVAVPQEHMQMGQSGEHKDCCKDCCKDMAAKDEGHGSEHSDHGAD